jgi:gamma-glutamyltranspeptidase/glutathione hydrolase
MILAVLVAGLLVSTARAADPDWLARSRHGMVASDSPEASQVGADVLKAGGNAFDAAVATSLALAVTRPQSTGLGGGGFVLAYVARDQKFVALDFRETAPAGATLEAYDRFEAAVGGPSPTVYGGFAVGVPGQVAGLFEIRQRYGTKPFADLAAPAIALAERGLVVDEPFRRACREVLDTYEKWPALSLLQMVLYETLLNMGRPVELGQTVPRSDLARALRMLAEHGPGAFYEGPIARSILTAVRGAEGVLAREDLQGYRVREREPLRVKIGPYEVVGMPPPSSGGVGVIEAWQILQAAAKRPDVQSEALRPHVLVEALKHVFADRARWLGDPDFVDVPVRRLIDPRYAAERAGQIRPEGPREPQAYGTTAPSPGDGGTSHFCIVDPAGNVVALTETINGVFGSYLVAETFGIVLNNEIDDFTVNPNEPNLFGLMQGRANELAPFKRPVSSMAPTIVLKDGKPVLVIGAAGGPRIISAVLQVIVAVLERGQSLEQAMSAVRLHHQWQPDEVCFDREPPPELLAALQKAGQKISQERKTATVQAIQILPDGTLVGACDPNRGGRPVGLP